MNGCEAAADRNVRFGVRLYTREAEMGNGDAVVVLRAALKCAALLASVCETRRRHATTTFINHFADLAQASFTTTLPALQILPCTSTL